MVTVHVEIGPGMWSCSNTFKLVACPHKGDYILVEEDSILCETVTIATDSVYVTSPHHFQSLESSDEYVAAGWKR